LIGRKRNIISLTRYGRPSADILTKAIHEIAKGKSFFSPAIAERMADSKTHSPGRDGLPKPGSARLSSRKMEVLQLVAEGKANKQIAAELGISILTVRRHRHDLMEKLSIHGAAGLTRYAVAHGIVERKETII